MRNKGMLIGAILIIILIMSVVMNISYHDKKELYVSEMNHFLEKSVIELNGKVIKKGKWGDNMIPTISDSTLLILKNGIRYKQKIESGISLFHALKHQANKEITEP